MSTPAGCNCCQTPQPGLRPVPPINLVKVDIASGDIVDAWSIPYSQITAVRMTDNGLVTITSQNANSNAGIGTNISYPTWASVAPGNWRGNGSAMAWDTDKKPTRTSPTTTNRGTRYGLIPDHTYNYGGPTFFFSFSGPGGAIDKTGRAFYMETFSTDPLAVSGPVTVVDKWLDVDGTEHAWDGSTSGMSGLTPFVVGRVAASLYDASFGIVEGRLNVAVYDGSVNPFTQTWSASVHAGTYLGNESTPCVVSVCPDGSLWVAHAAGPNMTVISTGAPSPLAWAFERVDPSLPAAIRIENFFPPGYLWFPTIFPVVGDEIRKSLREAQPSWFPPAMCANPSNGLTMCNRSYRIDFTIGHVFWEAEAYFTGQYRSISSLQKYHPTTGFLESDSYQDHGREFQCDQITYDNDGNCFVIVTKENGGFISSGTSQVFRVDDATGETLQEYDVIPPLSKPLSAICAQDGFLYVGSALPNNFVG